MKSNNNSPLKQNGLEPNIFIRDELDCLKQMYSPQEIVEMAKEAEEVVSKFFNDPKRTEESREDFINLVIYGTCSRHYKFDEK